MNNELSKRIKVLRGELSQKDFADRLGISLRAYQNYESGERLPPADVIEKISELCQVTADFILMGKELVDRPAVRSVMKKLEDIATDDDIWTMPLSDFLDKYEKPLEAAFVAESPEEYAPARDPRIDKIVEMFNELDEAGRQHIFDHVQATKRFINSRKKEAG